MALSTLNHLTQDASDPKLVWGQLSDMSLKPSAIVESWLKDQGSLTQALVNKSQNNFQVDLISEEWVTYCNPELLTKFGPLDSTHRFWSRKVILMGKNRPWVTAHTLLPEHSMFSPLKEVLELNKKPLGEFLFNHPQLIRTGLDFALVNKDFWGRRSLFFLFGKPIMVAEFFLPQFFTN
jgi:chorismate--pyruvate lyase